VKAELRVLTYFDEVSVGVAHVATGASARLIGHLVADFTTTSNGASSGQSC
jgi:hypothetical protein